MLAPVALFVYKRAGHMHRVLDGLRRNPQAVITDLFVYSDAPRNQAAEEGVQQVREELKDIRGFRSVTVVARDHNLGIASSITQGVDELTQRFGCVIVLEDDLLPSSHFLAYMNEALSRYEHDTRVVSIHAYCYPIPAILPQTFFLRGADCWGWATWRRGWEVFESNGEKLLAEIKRQRLESAFDFNDSYPYTLMLEDAVAGRNDSWAVRWYASAFLRGLLTLYPGSSQVQNIGADGSGQHVGATDIFFHREWGQPVSVENIPIEESLVARPAFIQFLRSTRPSLIRRAWHRLQRIGVPVWLG